MRYIFIFKPPLTAIAIKNFLSGRDVLCGLENALCIDMCVCLYPCVHTSACMHIHACVCTGMIYVTPTHLEMHAAFPYRYNFRIGTVVMVKNRAVIKGQCHVRPVVMKNIIPRGRVRRQVFRQEQCRAPRQYFIFFEITSCKNSETSYLE